MMSDRSTAPQRHTERTRLEVVVAGAGPVGLVLAIELARRGVVVRVVDQLKVPTTQSRAIAVHSRSLDHLEALGALDALMGRAVIANGMELHANGKVAARVPFTSITAVHPYSAALSQTETESVLTQRLAALGVMVEREITLLGYTQGADHVDIQIASAQGVHSVIRAQYLIGADGARSAVRQAMGQKLEGSFVGESFLLGDVDGEHPYDPAFFHTFFSPGTTTGLLFPLPGKRVRVFAQIPPGSDPSRPVTVDWLQSALDEREIRLSIRTAHWLARFELKHGQVARYRDGRVFLAGDAAHIHSPAGALGMNTGIQDACNLGWKLAVALRNGGAPSLLDSYQLERHPVAAEVIAFTTRLSSVGTLQSPLAQRARNILIHLGLEVPGVAERIAETVEQQRVRYRESPIVSGRGSDLRPGDHLYLPDTSVASALARSPGHLAVVLPATDGREDHAELPPGVRPLDISGRDAELLRRTTGLDGGGIVVIRPDGYVGHIGDSRAGVERYLRLLSV